MSPIRFWFCAVIGCAGLCLLAGCVPREKYVAMIQSDDPTLRAQGCNIAGRQMDKQVVPLLVDRLEDPADGVRLTAHKALRQITGEDFGYLLWAPPADRAEAVRKWRAYARSKGYGEKP